LAAETNIHVAQEALRSARVDRRAGPPGTRANSP
jgi:hypothetical protein